MNEISPPKATSFAYGSLSQIKMLEKYRNRENNHWKNRIAMAEKLVADHVTPLHGDAAPSDIILVDVGCSIGTFALEFGRQNYKSYGVDFDSAAIEIARDLANEENIAAEFLQMDVAEWHKVELPPIDIAVCFDIFEHLHDDEIGALLQGLKRGLSDKGRVVFSTTPTEYTYLFANRSLKFMPVRALIYAAAIFGSGTFARLTRAIAKLVDVWYLLARGKDHAELIKRDKHCNPLTETRLADIFRRAGFDFDLLETRQLYPADTALRRLLFRHPVMHSHIVGVARVR